MRTLRALALSLLTVVLLAGTAVGAGYAVRHLDERDTARPSGASDPGPTDAASPTPSAAPDADPTVAPSPGTLEPAFRIGRGDRGTEVRELQHRLFQLAWWPERTTGSYDPDTEQAVSGFQAKRGLPATGVVDRTTWRRLVSMTEEPTRDQLFNILRPGPTLLGPGASGDAVRDLQARLVQIAWLFGDVSGTYDDTTVQAVRGFQAKRAIPVTGAVDQRTLDRLVAMTRTPTHDEKHNSEPEPEPTTGGTAGLDPRCLTGRALCVDKTSNSLRWVVDGAVQATYDVRFGSDELPTREGAFSVFSKSRDHVSSLYDTSMPFAMFFSGGQAVHYSPDFAANGYSGASHGCVNVRDYDGIAALFDQVQIGDKVIVYWS